MANVQTPVLPHPFVIGDHDALNQCLECGTSMPGVPLTKLFCVRCEFSVGTDVLHASLL